MGIDLTAWLNDRDYEQVQAAEVSSMQVIVNSANQEFVQSNSILRIRQMEENGQLSRGAQFFYSVHPDDKYVDREIHSGNSDRGDAYIYPTKQAKDLIRQLAEEEGCELHLNNTGTTCWVSRKYN